MLRALSHSDRRVFVRACLRKARSAGELAAMSSLSAASVSGHLKVLRKCGVLKLDVRGRSWMYRTNASVVRSVVAGVRTLVKDS